MFGKELSGWISKVCKTILSTPHTTKSTPIFDNLLISNHSSDRRAPHADIRAVLAGGKLVIFIWAISNDYMMQVKSALTWIVAALHVPTKGSQGLFNISCSIDEGILGPPKLSQFHPDSSNFSCWTNMFKYAGIVELPLGAVCTNNKTEGLEIDFDLLIETAAVNRMLVTDDGILLFGFDTGLIPLEPADERRWHFMSTEGRQMTAEYVRRKYHGRRMRPTVRPTSADEWINRYEYRNGRVFVGARSPPLLKIGTVEPSDTLIECLSNNSGIESVEDLEENSERSKSRDVSFLGRLGISGASFGLSGGMKREQKYKQVSTVLRRTATSNFEQMLISMEKTPFILWDHSAKRAWLLPGNSVALFTALLDISKKKYTFQTRLNDEFHEAKLTYSDPSADGSKSARDCINENYNLRVNLADGRKVREDRGFDQILEDIWHRLSEGLDICISDNTGRRHKNAAFLYGYDLADALWGNCIPLRKLEIKESIKSWVPLSRNESTHVVFCHSIESVITCGSTSCVGVSLAAPTGSQPGVLGCFLGDICRLYGINGKSSLRNNLPHPVGDKFEWVPVGCIGSGGLGADTNDDCTCCIGSLQAIRERDTKARKLQKKNLKTLRGPPAGDLTSARTFERLYDKVLRFGCAS
jgi:hypothetical protein